MSTIKKRPALSMTTRHQIVIHMDHPEEPTHMRVRDIIRDFIRREVRTVRLRLSGRWTTVPLHFDANLRFRTFLNERACARVVAAIISLFRYKYPKCADGFYYVLHTLGGGRTADADAS